ncbi:hypothetical protein ACQQ2N_14615 [Dokdonella sp. MW10]|uniref:hypothetical protein n=1 Tax=Dokdonella sp. MW10 TaxID=2992926 RepID=UPI003F7ED85A
MPVSFHATERRADEDDGTSPSIPDYARRFRERHALWHRRHFTRNAVLGLLALALLLNLGWVLTLHGVMLTGEAPDAGVAIQVSVIEPPTTYEVPPEPEPPAFERRPSRIVVAPPTAKTPPPPRVEEAPSTTSARIGSAGTPAPKLFNPDGSLRLPEAGAVRIGPAPEPENPQAAASARWAEMQERGENPLDCTRTRFAKGFRTDQSVGDRVAGKYLSWIGLADQQGIAERAAAREQRAADGCDPPPKVP